MKEFNEKEKAASKEEELTAKNKDILTEMELAEILSEISLKLASGKAKVKKD